MVIKIQKLQLHLLQLFEYFELVSFFHIMIYFNCFDLSDPRIVLLGMAAALFDASFHVYMIEWTPILQRAQKSNDNHPLPLGILFATGMVRIGK